MNDYCIFHLLEEKNPIPIGKEIKFYFCFILVIEHSLWWLENETNCALVVEQSHNNNQDVHSANTRVRVKLDIMKKKIIFLQCPCQMKCGGWQVVKRVYLEVPPWLLPK